MRFIRIAGLFVVLMLSAFFLWVYAATYHPKDMQQQPVVTEASAPKLQAGQSLRVLSWNVQFLAGNSDNHFFYDGGADPWPSLVRTEETAKRMAAVIDLYQPDIILFQELDEGADRTHRTNQLEMLQEALLNRYPVRTEAFYWKADFVPHPQVWGKAGMKLSILSKYQIQKSYRHALPAIISDDIVTRQFNIKRAVQQVLLPLEGGGQLHVFNTHFSAFAQGDDTMRQQVAKMMALIDPIDKQGGAWLAGGDYNLLASDSIFRSLPPKAQSYYNPEGTELAPMISAYAAVPMLADMISSDAAQWYTHMPSSDPNRQPNRTIDYIFHGGLGVTDAAVIRGDAMQLSDHLPVFAVFKLPEQGTF